MTVMQAVLVQKLSTTRPTLAMKRPVHSDPEYCHSRFISFERDTHVHFIT